MAKRYDGLVVATGNGQWHFMEDKSMRIETEQEATLIIGPPERLIPESEVIAALKEYATAVPHTTFSMQTIAMALGISLDPA